MKKVEIIKKKRVYDDFFKIDEAILKHQRFDGQMSEPVRRLNFERGDSVAALVWNKETQKVILINQFRYPTYEKGPGWVWEIVAGVLGKDEEPGAAIGRELQEEIGYRVENIDYISTFYVSPGGSSERIILYYAEVGAGDKVSDGGGLESEHEDIRVMEFSPPALKELKNQGDIVDAKTLIALMWFEINHPGKMK
ncbi:MAG: NUDIX hydrolase [bacterium]|nr:NUDIX hydrolase [bacterium]